MKNSFINLVCSELAKLVGSCGEELRGHTLVFPGRRAVMFFQKAWLERKGKATWLPECVTVQELFGSLDKNRYIIADDLALCVELFKLLSSRYADLMGTALAKDFDMFYSWGNTIIADFDDIDKNCANARLVFSNMQGLVDIKSDHLTDEQKELLEKFFNFSFDDNNEMLEHFSALCGRLFDIYTDFKAVLKAKGWAYDGMRSREVTETEELNLDPEMEYSFIGFNVLNKVETELFRKIGKARTHFYWDYDYLYTAVFDEKKGRYMQLSDDEIQALIRRSGEAIVQYEAGKHIRKNLKSLGSAIEDEEQVLYDNFKRVKKKIRFISTTTNTAQAKYLTTYLEELKNSDMSVEEKLDTAIVLCDENLLQPVLHSIPSHDDEQKDPAAIPGEQTDEQKIEELPVNVTMGYPLNLTPAGSLLKTMVQYQNYLSAYCQTPSSSVLLKSIMPVLRHPYISEGHPEALALAREWQNEKKFYIRLSELLEAEDKDGNAVFKPLLPPVWESCDKYLDWMISELKMLAKIKKLTSNALLQESLYRAFTLVERLKKTLSELDGVNVSADMVGRLLTQLINSTTIPFHGEADKGLQVMGFLETRGLDFRNVVLVSAGEGVLPPKANITSFIPQSIRGANGLTTIENQSSVYAYYFYRLLQRAENVTILYNGIPSLTSSGQMSRFMMQLLVDTDLEIERCNMESSIPSLEVMPIVVEKNGEVMKNLDEYFEADTRAYISPSALNTYISCPLKFYFQQIMKIRPKQEQEEMQSTDIGTIFHAAMEEIYQGKEGCSIDEYFIKSYLDDEGRLSAIVDHQISENFFNGKQVTEADYSGRMQIDKKMIIIYVRKQLQRDLHHCPFTYIESEGNHKIEVVLSNGRSLKVGGLIDRVDEKDGCLRVVDYKTGGTEETVKDFASMIDASKPYDRRPHYPFQTAIYSLMLNEERGVPVYPSLSYVSSMKMDMDQKEDKQGVIMMGSGRDKAPMVIDQSNRDEFRSYLIQAIEPIFNPDIAFSQTDCIKNCEYCDFANICRKG